MTRKARNRMAAVLIAVSVCVSSGLYYGPLGKTSLGLSLGLSGGGATDPSLGQSEDGPGLGWSAPPAQDTPTATAGDYSALKSAITQSTGDLTVYLTGNITWGTDYIEVAQGRKITIDGLDTYGITQTSSADVRTIQALADSQVTLRNLFFEGRNNHGAIWAKGANAKGIFENITYVGPQPFYGSGGNNEIIVRGISSFEIRAQSGDSNGGEEFNECARVTFDGGKTNIIHAKAGANGNAVFYMIHGSADQGYIQLINGADVTVESGNYVLFTNSAVGRVPLRMESGTRLDITAGSFNRTSDHPVGGFSMGEDAYFSYTQNVTPYTGDAVRYMYVKGDIHIGRNSTFLINTRARGFRMSDSYTFTADQPRLVSIYGDINCFYDSSGKLAISQVNAVNYWTTTRGNPAGDSANEWPEYMWNTWATQGDGTYQIGERFSFSGSKNGAVDSGGDIPDVRNPDGPTLAKVFQFSPAARRVAFGNIDLFSVEQVNPAGGAIYGQASCSDIMAEYQTEENGSLRTWSTGLPLPFHSAAGPKTGTRALVVANSGGLRAGVWADVAGALELLSAPRYIYYGSHEVPVATTLYGRKEVLPNDGQGRMLVQVRDSRGDAGTPWELKLAVSHRQVPGKETIPPSSLLFRTKDGGERYLSGEGAVTVHSEAGPDQSPTEYTITWEEDQGLLTEFSPGQPDPGQYGVILNWSIQVPVEE